MTDWQTDRQTPVWPVVDNHASTSSLVYRPDAVAGAQRTESKHWSQRELDDRLADSERANVTQLDREWLCVSDCVCVCVYLWLWLGQWQWSVLAELIDWLILCVSVTLSCLATTRLTAHCPCRGLRAQRFYLKKSKFFRKWVFVFCKIYFVNLPTRSCIIVYWFLHH